MKKHLLVGLGNPGGRYKNTRHNIGFMLAEALGGKFNPAPSLPFRYCAREAFIIVKPATFVNKSGIAVKSAMEYFNFAEKEIIVACDDFNLPAGKLRLRGSGSSGGHKGLKSVIDSLGTKNFPRLRMGIGGMQAEDKVAFVLGKFKPAEKKIINDMLIDALKLVKYYARKGLGETMNRFN